VTGLVAVPPRAALVALPATSRKRGVGQAHRILRVSRVVADLNCAEAFYRDALAFRTIQRGAMDSATRGALGAGDAEEIVMRLGGQEIALVRFAVPGRRYPADSHSNDLYFQHVAIVVQDMEAAYAHLSARSGWRPISEDGPALLPPANGAVQAFKFRDPDGHPLELIWFPPGQGRLVWQQPASGCPFLGIDHSALSVQATSRSVAFYRGLGLTLSSRSFNHGPAQERLDGLARARVRVTGLRPLDTESAGLELLGYRPPGRHVDVGAANDAVTDWVTLAAGPLHGMAPQAVRDPDGHLLVLVGQGAATIGSPA
jgi:catechol 2,3-dioxygenase-like lactoylglutathione lyase family enzyme